MTNITQFQAGRDAAIAGLPRDGRRSADWLAGWDQEIYRVLVCGGRDFQDVAFVCATLTRVIGKSVATIIHGACPNGADAHAAYFAKTRGHHEWRFPADWKAHGKAAGPIRNQRMLDEAKPDIVIAFPGGRGTADMVKRAIDAGVHVFSPQP